MKILIIKLGALGDVLRTTGILLAIKEKFPDSEISWITKKESKTLLEHNPYLTNIWTIPYKTDEEFGILYNFDIEDEATLLASEIKAEKKFGFCYNGGYPAAFNFNSEYYLNTLFDDEIKKTNNKTYQEMIFEAAELSYRKHPYSFYLTEEDKIYAENFVKKNNINTKNLIGIHIGSSKRWPSKSWSDEKIIEFIRKSKEKGCDLILFGGEDEKEKQEKIISELVKENIHVYKNDYKNSIREFASLVNLCKTIICPDSFSLHISLAMKKQTIALFFCTSPREVEGYGFLKKLISPLLKDFFPERSDEYSEELVNSICVEDVLNALEY